MSAYDDVEIAIRFLKSVHTKDPKTDLEIGLIVERLEALVAPAKATDGTPHATGLPNADGPANEVRYHHGEEHLANVNGQRQRRR
jgi:hypothetical protein